MSDSDSEEEILVYADFQDNISVEELANASSLSINFIGIDNEKPIVELNGKFFKGTIVALLIKTGITSNFCFRYLRFLRWNTRVFRKRRRSFTFRASF